MIEGIGHGQDEYGTLSVEVRWKNVMILLTISSLSLSLSRALSLPFFLVNQDSGIESSRRLRAVQFSSKIGLYFAHCHTLQEVTMDKGQFNKRKRMN